MASARASSHARAFRRNLAPSVGCNCPLDRHAAASFSTLTIAHLIHMSSSKHFPSFSCDIPLALTSNDSSCEFYTKLVHTNRSLTCRRHVTCITASQEAYGEKAHDNIKNGSLSSRHTGVSMITAWCKRLIPVTFIFTYRVWKIVLSNCFPYGGDRCLFLLCIWRRRRRWQRHHHSRGMNMSSWNSSLAA